MGNCPLCLLKVVASFQTIQDPTPALAKTDPAPLGDQALFGDYELLEEIARGGMGIVYKARQRSLNREVAVKAMLSGQFASDAFIKRFKAEAEAAAALRHPNIVAIHEIGRHSGQYFFSMDYIHGTNLAELVREKPLPARQAAEYLKVIAEAVHYAHQNGILHRDLKPSNILIDSHGRPKVTDFGLAKRFDSNSDLTLTGQVLGSPQYMPPEQAVGKTSELTPASDVYALGAILYHVLTGRPPFMGESPAEVIQQTLNAEPLPPQKLIPSIPADLETICLKCLAKEQSRRYSTAAALAEDLGRYLHGQPIVARPASPAHKFSLWCRRRPTLAISLIATALLLVALAVGSNMAVVRISAESAKVKNEAERAAKAEKQVTEKLWASYLSLARANRFSHQPGQRLLTLDVLSKAAKIQPSMALRNEAIAAMALPDARLVKERRPHYLEFPHHAIAFAPDMRTYAEVLPKGKVSLRRVDDDAEIRTLGANPSEVEWLPGFSTDGNYLHATYASSKGTVLDVRDGSVVLQRLTGGSFSSDSKQFIAVNPEGFITLFDLASGKETYRLPKRVGKASLQLQPGNQFLACRVGKENAVQVLELPSGRWVAEIPCEPDSGCAWSRDGKLLVIPCVDGFGYIWNLETHELRKTQKAHGRRMTRAAFSNDGRLLASTSWDDTVRLWDAVSGRQLLSFQGSSYQMMFSPDDRWLAFVVKDTGRFGLIEITVPPEFHSINAFDEPHQNEFLSISPDGRWIATGSAQGEGIRLIDFSTGKQATLLPEKECVSVTFSHDGKALFAATPEAVVKWSLEFAPNPGQPPTIHSARELLPLPEECWDIQVSSNGLQLGVTNQKEDKAFLFDLRSRKISGSFPHSQIKHLALSPDGKWLVTAPRNGSSIKVWDLAKSQVVARFPATTANVLFSPDGRWLVTSGKIYKIYETGTWREHTQIAGPTRNPGSLAMGFSPDGTLLAIQHGPNLAQLLEMPSARPLASFETPDLAQLSRIAFSQDGEHLILLSIAGNLDIWNLTRVRAELRRLGLDWNGGLSYSKLPSSKLQLRARPLE